MKKVLSWIGIAILLAAGVVGWVLYMGTAGERNRLAADVSRLELNLQNAGLYIGSLQQDAGRLMVANGAAALRIKELEVRLEFLEGRVVPLPGEGDSLDDPFACRGVSVQGVEMVMCPFFEPRDQWERRRRSIE